MLIKRPQHNVNTVLLNTTHKNIPLYSYSSQTLQQK